MPSTLLQLSHQLLQRKSEAIWFCSHFHFEPLHHRLGIFDSIKNTGYNTIYAIKSTSSPYGKVMDPISGQKGQLRFFRIRHDARINRVHFFHTAKRNPISRLVPCSTHFPGRWAHSLIMNTFLLTPRLWRFERFGLSVYTAHPLVNGYGCSVLKDWESIFQLITFTTYVRLFDANVHSSTLQRESDIYYF